MKITNIGGHDVLSYRDVDLPLPGGLTVLVGPNGAGKTNLLRLVALVREAVRSSATSDWKRLEVEYAGAGREGGGSFEVRLGVQFDLPVERDLWSLWLRASLVEALTTMRSEAAPAVDAALADALAGEAAAPFWSGTVVLRRDGRWRHPWRVHYEVAVPARVVVPLVRPPDIPAHMSLAGGVGGLVDSPRPGDGPEESPARQAANIGLGLEGDVVTGLKGRRIDLSDLLDVGGVELVARAHGLTVEAGSVSALLRALGRDAEPQAIVGPAHVLAYLLGSIVIVDNVRVAPLVEVPVSVRAEPASLEDGSGAALELLALKVGDRDARARFAHVVAVFRAITGNGLDVREEILRVDSTFGSDRANVLVAPVVVEGSAGRERDVPLRLAGAGATEALLLALLLTISDAPVLFDEPATNLSSTAQRRLLTLLGRVSTDQQVLVVTHSTGLVPWRQADDITGLVRVRPGAEGSVVVRLEAQDLRRALALMRASEFRELLFAVGVVLVEGPTEVEVLEEWLGDGIDGLPSPEDANIVVRSVDGDSNFVGNARLLDELGIPWIVLSDGPGLRHGGPVSRLLSRRDRPVETTPFLEATEAYRRAGVHTLADGFWFRDPQKRGEIEAWFARVNGPAWDRVGQHGKPRVGRAFARSVAAPEEVKAFWRVALARIQPSPTSEVDPWFEAPSVSTKPPPRSTEGAAPVSARFRRTATAAVSWMRRRAFRRPGTRTVTPGPTVR